MRLVTWNCRVGGFRNKAHRVATFRPDVLAVQEVERLESVLLFSGDSQPTFRDRAFGPSLPRRGIGVLSYTATSIQSVDSDDVSPGFRRFEVQHEDLHFNLAAVWTSVRKPRPYRQVHDGLQQYADWIRARPTVVLGDFNSSKSFPSKTWEELEPLVDAAGLVSAYHTFFNEPCGAETRHTHFYRGKADNPFHIDYCFIPKAWASRIQSVDVPPYSEWSSVSDHVPLIVDINR